VDKTENDNDAWKVRPQATAILGTAEAISNDLRNSMAEAGKKRKQQDGDAALRLLAQVSDGEDSKKPTNNPPHKRASSRQGSACSSGLLPPSALASPSLSSPSSSAGDWFGPPPGLGPVSMMDASGEGPMYVAEKSEHESSSSSESSSPSRTSSRPASPSGAFPRLGDSAPTVALLPGRPSNALNLAFLRRPDVHVRPLVAPTKSWSTKYELEQGLNAQAVTLIPVHLVLLIRKGVMTKADMPAFEQFCEAQGAGKDTIVATRVEASVAEGHSVAIGNNCACAQGLRITLERRPAAAHRAAALCIMRNSCTTLFVLLKNPLVQDCTNVPICNFAADAAKCSQSFFDAGSLPEHRIWRAAVTGEFLVIAPASCTSQLEVLDESRQNLVVRVHFKPQYKEAWHFNRRPFILCLLGPIACWSMDIVTLAQRQATAMLSFAWTADPQLIRSCKVVDQSLVQFFDAKVGETWLQCSTRRPCGNMRGSSTLLFPDAAKLDAEQRGGILQDVELRSLSDPVLDFRLSEVNAGQLFTQGSIAMYIGKRPTKNKRKHTKQYCDSTRQWFKAGVASSF
jgi:hypothetical protein